MSHRSSTPLIIISDNQAHIAVLREACAAQFDIIHVGADFSELQLSDHDKDNFIVVTLSASNREAALQYASNNFVFLLVEDKTEFDISVFEDVFQYPIRLGQLVEGMKNVAQQKELHKRMAPIMLGDFVLNPQNSSLSHRNVDVRLTEKEAAILIFLSAQGGNPVSRQALLDEVWGYAKDVETHTLETHIYRLRQKIKTQFMLDDFLVTKDEGYILNF